MKARLQLASSRRLMRHPDCKGYTHSPAVLFHKSGSPASCSAVRRGIEQRVFFADLRKNAGVVSEMREGMTDPVQPRRRITCSEFLGSPA
jgi:hypothetical protein